MRLLKRVGGLAATILLVGLGSIAIASPAQAADFNPIKNLGNSMCLQPENGSTAEFAAIVQASCNPNNPAQLWRYFQVGTNHFAFENFASRFCFDAFDGAFNGARLLQGSCVHISNEEFNTGARLPDVVKIETRIHFRDNGFCVDVPQQRTDEGLAMQIFQCNGTVAQRWIMGFPFYAKPPAATQPGVAARSLRRVR